jgi:hypothetical protein
MSTGESEPAYPWDDQAGEDRVLVVVCQTNRGQSAKLAVICRTAFALKLIEH